MKSIFLSIFILLAWNVCMSQAPEKMSYQAVVLNASNSPVVNSPVGMRISILQGAPGGTAMYVETHIPTTNANGLVTVEIGSGTIVSGTFSSINWGNGPYFLQTETDPLGGTNYTISGTSQLLSVPFALYAKTAESIVGGGSGGGSGGAFSHFIGEQYGGGVIFDLWKDAQGVEHGLIVDPIHINIPSGVTWSNVSLSFVDSVYVPSDGWSSALSAWDGLSNSMAIVNQPGHTNSFAALCLNSTNGGYDDWYMPAIEELNLLWQNRFAVSRTLKNISGSTLILPHSSWSGETMVWYWASSTEFYNDQYDVFTYDTWGGASAVTMLDFFDKSAQDPWTSGPTVYNDGINIIQYNCFLRAIRAF